MRCALKSSIAPALLLSLIAGADYGSAQSGKIASYHDSLKARKLSCDRLQSIIQEKKITSIEALLRLLPQEYKRNAILRYRSRSLQFASETAPRVILFGDNARTILTFSGAPGEAGYQAIEMLDWDERLGTHVPCEFDFSKKRPHFTKNPNSCMSCHGEKAKVIWESYPFWPGIYGSDDSELIRGSVEHNFFMNFLTNVYPKDPRYKELKLHLDGKDFDGNATTVTYLKNSSFKIGKFGNGPQLDFGTDLSHLTARKIWDAIRAEPSYSKLAPIFTAWAGSCFDDPDAPRGSLLKFESFFLNPKEARESLKAMRSKMLHGAERAYEIIRKEMVPLNESTGTELSRRQEEEINFEKWRTDPSVTIYPGASKANRFGGVESTLFYERSDGESAEVILSTLMAAMNLNLSDFSSSEIPDSYAFSDGAVSIIPYLKDLIRRQEPTRTRVAQEVATPSSFGAMLDRKYCERLRIRSIELQIGSLHSENSCPDDSGRSVSPATTGLIQNIDLILKKDTGNDQPPRALSSCVNCHVASNSVDAPVINFGDKSKLKTELERDRGLYDRIRQRVLSEKSESRMPPNRSISKEEIAEILGYVRKLSVPTN